MLRALRIVRGLRGFPLRNNAACWRKLSSYDTDHLLMTQDPIAVAKRESHRNRVLAESYAEDEEDFSHINFDVAFDATNCEDIHDVKEGGYVNIDPNVLKTYLPEGFAGEMEEEFEVSDRKSWMIRDSTKLLCRIVEEFENAGKRRRGDTEFQPNRQGLAIPVDLPGLTDREEWPDATLRAFYYGAELNKGFERNYFTAHDDDADEVSEVSETPKVTQEGEEGEEPTDPNATIMYTVRGEGSLVEEYIKTMQADGKKIPERIMLTGDRGVGKSCTLNQVVLHARQRGWIVLFVNQGWEQVWGGDYIEPVTINDPPDTRTEEELLALERISDAYELDDPERWMYTKPVLPEDMPSPEGTIYDNPSQTALVLRGFYKAHSELLKTIPLKFPKELEKYDPILDAFADAYIRVKSLSGRTGMTFMEVREIVEDENADEDLDELDEEVLGDFDYTPAFRPKNLEEFVRMGIAFRDYAGPIFMDIVKELKELDLPDHPVMFAVDEYNAWDAPSSFSYRRKKVIGTEMCVPAALRFCSVKKADTEHYKLKNGLCIATTSLKHNNKKEFLYEDYKSSVPLVIRVPCYSQVEMAAVICYYRKTGAISPNVQVNTVDVNTYRMQTGYQGSEEDILFGGGNLDDGLSMGGKGSDDEMSDEEVAPVKKKFSKGGKKAAAAESDNDD